MLFEWKSLFYLLFLRFFLCRSMFLSVYETFFSIFFYHQSPRREENWIISMTIRLFDCSIRDRFLFPMREFQFTRFFSSCCLSSLSSLSSSFFIFLWTAYSLFFFLNLSFNHFGEVKYSQCDVYEVSNNFRTQRSMRMKLSRDIKKKKKNRVKRIYILNTSNICEAFDCERVSMYIKQKKNELKNTTTKRNGKFKWKCVFYLFYFFLFLVAFCFDDISCTSIEA